MDRKVLNKRLGLFCNSIAQIIVLDGPTAVIYERFRSRLQEFLKNLEECTTEVEVLQAGSSFDNLHMTRCWLESTGRFVFHPQTDFDFLLIFKTLLLSPEKKKDGGSSCGDSTGDNRIGEPSILNFFGTICQTKYPRYFKVRISEHGKRFLLEKGRKDVLETVTDDGFIPNNFLTRTGAQTGKYAVTGPALTDLITGAGQGFSYDYLHALPVYGWPDAASEWLTRKRPTGWPSQALVEQVAISGCVLVPVGYYTSDEKHLEWRLAFSHGERLLSSSLNEVQRRCYCLVKLLLKTSLTEGCILSPYHVKNIFFYMLESREDLQWESEQLGMLLVEVLDEVMRALANHVIPNYLVRLNNMIQHKSKEDVSFTLKEVSKLRDRPMIALAGLCQYLQLYHKKSDFTYNESRACLEIYVVLNKSLNTVGMDRILVDADLSSSCFNLIVQMNKAMPAAEFTKQGNLFASESVVDLLLPTALQCTQEGDVIKALALHKIMFSHATEAELKTNHQILTNLGCLNNCIANALPQNSVAREDALTEAQKYFEKALVVNGSSHELHFTYGNFLYTNQLSFTKAMEHLNHACASGQDVDSEIFLSIEIPGKDVTNMATVGSKVASFYFLALCLCDMQEIYDGRKALQKFVEVCQAHELEGRANALQMCALAHFKLGLQGKAMILQEEARNAGKAASRIQSNVMLAEMYVQFNPHQSRAKKLTKTTSSPFNIRSVLDC